MTYPRVMTERETLAEARAGRSIARFGDGELNICAGGAACSQKQSMMLKHELCEILRPLKWGGPLLPCIPNLRSDTPRRVFWNKYGTSRFNYFEPGGEYGSSFITRPDNAPWIDRPEYWQDVRGLWRGKSIAFVGGEPTLLKVLQDDVARVETYIAPTHDAYSELDAITRWCLLRPYDAVVIALGAAGTALAGRLAGAQHALDLGHIGMFMTHPGAFSLNPDQLASPAYRKLLQHAHATTTWGRGGVHWAEPVAKFAKKLEAADVLDYGCGGGTLKPALKPFGVKCLEYDPGVIGKDILPKLADVVVSTDVFEHIEPDNVANVLAHTFALARKGAFFIIAKQPAKKILADGRNAHLVCQPTEWWIDRLVEAGWKRENICVVLDVWKKCTLTLTK